MIFNRKLLQFLGYISNKREKISVEPDDTSQMLEEEVQRDVEEISTMRVDSAEYGRASESIKNLCEAIEKHDKLKVERRKVDQQIAESYQRRMIDWSQLIPKLVSIGAYALVTCVLLALERQTPLSMRWLKALEILIAPKGI